MLSGFTLARAEVAQPGGEHASDDDKGPAAYGASDEGQVISEKLKSSQRHGGGGTAPSGPVFAEFSEEFLHYPV